MIRFIFLLLFVTTVNVDTIAQQIDYNIQNGYVASGYDVTEYFNQKAAKGNKKISFVFENATYLFSSEENKNRFKKNPHQYIPQYGGWCAYAMSYAGDKVNINPKTFEIRDGKLYLFYNAYFNNTLNSWKKGNTELFKKQADSNWLGVRYEK